MSLTELSHVPREEQKFFKDCAAAYKSGFISSGVYTLQIPNTTITAKAFCDMETSGGGWMVIQRRKDGSVDFQRNWKEYKMSCLTSSISANVQLLMDCLQAPFRQKPVIFSETWFGMIFWYDMGQQSKHLWTLYGACMGFGSPHGEYWLGNEFVHLLTTQGSYSLHVRLQDWENNEVYSLYDHFFLGPEKQNYRLYVQRYSGTAGRTSSLSLSGMDFSTKDVDNDNCLCKCAQLLSGGWWFDACGPSNLNGLYHLPNPTSNRMNGIKWHYWKGPNYSLKMSAMMIRPMDFREE
uniref:Uncharacterized protein n=1 Tax=Sphaerodactylus townsendi TaxID=933632 RepID=A0ACB8FRG7_9SAUR